jgi:hypothetical protein
MASWSAKILEEAAAQVTVKKQLEDSEALCDEMERQIKLLNDQLAESEEMIQWLRARVEELETERLRQLEAEMEWA